jgi:hypothetical protein
MAVLTAGRVGSYTRDPGQYRKFKVGNDIVYAGGIVSMLISGGTGVLLAGQDTDNHRVVGIAMETVDGTGGDEPYCNVMTEGSVLLNATSCATSWVGVAGCCADDQTVVLAASVTHNIIVGLIEEVDTTNETAWVRLQPSHVTA